MHTSKSTAMPGTTRRHRCSTARRFTSIFGSSGPRAALAAIALLLASACAHGAATPSAKLWIGGDVFLGTGGHGALAGIPAIVGGAPGIVNLEGPVGADGNDHGGDRGDGQGSDRSDDRGSDRSNGRTSGNVHRPPIRLLHAPRVLAELRTAGVIAAGIANNHARDAGPGGGAATVRALAAIGVGAAGGPAGPATLMLGRLRVVVTAHDLEAGVPPTLRAELVAARRRGDVLVATFHVTGPPTYLPRPELLDAVAVALEAGAAVIAAHGTHELARVERRGHAVIAWGLGNLAFACACTDEQSGAILEVVLGPDGAGEASIIPVDAGLAGTAARAAGDPALTFELLEALGATRLQRLGGRARF
jgi:poly-gamma-glutamate synthesis protein (capsule biosynthesis protein)